jgi:hypothetical protein
VNRADSGVMRAPRPGRRSGARRRGRWTGVGTLVRCVGRHDRGSNGRTNIFRRRRANRFMLCGFVDGFVTYSRPGGGRPPRPPLSCHTSHTRGAHDCARIAMRKNPITTCMPSDLRSWARRHGGPSAVPSAVPSADPSIFQAFFLRDFFFFFGFASPVEVAPS